MSDLKSVSGSSVEKQQELFRPFGPDDDFKQFTLDDGLEVLILDDGSTEAGKLPDGREGYSDKQAAVILYHYIHSKISLKDAERAILDMLPEAALGGSNAQGMFSSFVIQLAQQIPYNHPSGQARLVQLVRRVYRTLSLEQLKIDIYENFEPDLDDDRPVPGDPLALTLNLLAFLARLSSNGVLDLTSYGVQTMRRGLEKRHEESKYADCYISLAALWIIFAGQSLYTAVVEAPVTEQADGTAVFNPGPLYEGRGPVFGRERWGFWKDMLKGAADGDVASTQSRKLAEGAAMLMDAIERSVEF